jgi:hypothetical protein
MNDQFDIMTFEAELKHSLEEGRKAFKGTYKNELDALAGLSRDKINAITPDLTDLEKYDELLTLVKKASSANLSQSELKNQIEKLGDIAIKIAKHVPSLSKILLA